MPIPKNAITNNYRKTRLLRKGCPKLLRLVDKHHVNVDKSIQDKNRINEKLGTNVDRIKLSIMTNRANMIYTPNLAKTMDESPLKSTGFSTHKNANLKPDLSRTTQKNYSGAPPNFPTMVVDRQHANSSELNQSSEMPGKAHVPKLLLTQALQFQNHQKQKNGDKRNGSAAHATSLQV